MILSRATRQFWRLLNQLPADVRQTARSAYGLFRTNPAHPSLHFKKVERMDDVYSVRIGLGYRALGSLKKDRIIWFWIGSHADYDRLV